MAAAGGEGLAQTPLLWVGAALALLGLLVYLGALCAACRRKGRKKKVPPDGVKLVDELEDMYSTVCKATKKKSQVPKREVVGPSSSNTSGDWSWDPPSDRSTPSTPSPPLSSHPDSTHFVFGEPIPRKRKNSTKVMFKCLWKSCGKVLSSSSGMQKHIRTVHLGRPRGEAKKCRKVYGMENRELWCTACRWKKACQRFLD
ncbi:PREDICTED: zinc finger protein 704-like [Chaetura pelagica]|uniref:zinc finger protein 704-like n=1 Tax=Chaetura pelagica TaxID=8897 RepID=UPI0005231CD0|nr:PREDICTED: zinc finger protein 704-like [Chaetura pelagica]